MKGVKGEKRQNHRPKSLLQLCCFFFVVCKSANVLTENCLSIDLHVVVHLSVKLISSLGLTSLAMGTASTTATTTTTTTTAGTLGALLSLVLVVAGRSPRKKSECMYDNTIQVNLLASWLECTFTAS
jgi:hypothetical protein